MTLRSDSESRESALAEAAVDAARAWADGCVRVLALEGRAIAGSWPGTVNEARARSRDRASRRLVSLSLSPLTHDELGRITRITYDEARRLWRASATSTG